ncbi:MAG TPA: hypothetical protein DEF34_06240 [Desulfotomaculum sp.]|nr:MAG: hypothetical protein VR67_16845 [Peptococcaceae bacterium BRH_c8a]KJS72706.1 MAG: hypothetical protein JL56_12055 [Desulfotomaculum sp. BICA1-6]HBX23212.1 hypothetical protein [Desulfotomaculum sp.]
MNKNVEEIKDAVLKAAVEGKLSCTNARRLAEELGVPTSEIGRVADELKIKLFGCELGCF